MNTVLGNKRIKNYYKKSLSILFTILFVITFSSCSNTVSNTDKEYYCYQIYSLIKDLEFHTAELVNSKIVLYNSQNEPIQEIVFENYTDSIKVKNIRKENSIIFFATDGSVDDETGILFINDDCNSMLNGINTIKRIGGNSYQYSTWK